MRYIKVYGLRNLVAITLGIISGVILIWTDTVGNLGFFLPLVPRLVSIFSFPPEIILVVAFFFNILNYLALAGGWTVILGCFLVALGRHRTGAWIMGIGTGLSLISLIWKLLQLWFIGSLDINSFMNTFQGVAWIGAILSVIAQETVKPSAQKV